MRRSQPQPGGVNPFRTALALEELDLPREAAERMREPKRRIVGTTASRARDCPCGLDPVAMAQSAAAWLTIG
jgi:hypothetical protein